MITSSFADIYMTPQAQADSAFIRAAKGVAYQGDLKPMDDFFKGHSEYKPTTEMATRALCNMLSISARCHDRGNTVMVGGEVIPVADWYGPSQGAPIEALQQLIGLGANLAPFEQPRPFWRGFGDHPLRYAIHCADQGRPQYLEHMLEYGNIAPTILRNFSQCFLTETPLNRRLVA